MHQLFFAIWSFLFVPFGPQGLTQQIISNASSTTGNNIAFVSQCVNASASGATTSVACSTTMNIAAGNTVAVFYGRANTSGSVSSVSDGGTNTFNAAASTCGTTTTYIAQWWVAKNTTAHSGATITVNLSGGTNYRAMWAVQFSGLNISSPVDTGAGAACAGLTTSSTPTSATFSTTNANEVVLMAASNASISQTWSPGSGYTLGTVTGDQDTVGQYKTFSNIQSSITSALSSTVSSAWGVAVLALTQ